MLHMEMRDEVGVVRLDRPPANALNHDLIGAVLTLLPDLRRCAAAVLTGTGRFFSTGLDLHEVSSCQGGKAAAFCDAFDEGIAGLLEARRLRLAGTIVPARELMGRAIARAEELASRPRLAFVSTKRALRREARERMAAARASGTDPTWAAWQGDEVLRAMEAYRARTVSRKGA